MRCKSTFFNILAFKFLLILKFCLKKIPKMKYLFLSLVCFLGMGNTLNAQEYKEMIDAGNYPVSEVITSAEAYFENIDKGKGSGYKHYKRWEYNALRLQNEDGFLNTDLENMQELTRYNSYLNETAASRASLLDNWEELGPFNYNNLSSWSPGLGRITGFSIAEDDIDHIIVGAETGGVWKTLDGGATWQPLGDYFSNLYVYSVTIDPTNSMVYYFGSRNGLVFKSLDAGATWNAIGSIGNSSINKIVVNPDFPDILFATASYEGIYRSEDAGSSWTQITNDDRGFDITFKPGDTQVVYVSGRQVHKSINGGVDFTTLAIPSADAQMMGVSQDDPNVVYVIQSDSGVFGGIYRSDNDGDLFTELDQGSNNYFGYSTTGNDNRGQAPRDMDIDVNPNNINEVHIAGIQTWRSLDGGVSFTCTSNWLINDAANQNIGYCHADVDVIGFRGSTLFVGTDGGFYKAEDTQNLTANYFEHISIGMGIRQWYRIGVSQTQDVVITGGSQDNGSSFYTQDTGWRDWVGADGMEGFVSKSDPDTMFGMIQFGNMYRTTNQGVNVSGINTPDQGEWVTPMEQDPTVNDRLYVGYDRVYRSNDNGTSWTAVSQQFGTDIDHIKIANSNNQVMYLAREFRFYKTTDAGATDWEQISTPGGFVNSIAIHPTDANKIAVATSSNNSVFISNDGGDSWISYKKNLPNFSALALAWDDNGQDGLYLGMDYGIYYIDNMLEDWQPYNTNLPNVIINELEINNTTNTLYAATYGRGLWASPLVEDNLGTANFITESQVVLVPNPASSLVTIKVPHQTEADVRVFDTSGKLMIYKRDVQLNSQYQLDISKLKAGIYFIRINTAVGIVTKKLIRQ